MSTVFDTIPEVSFIDNLTLEQEYEYELTDFQTEYKKITGKTLVLPDASPWRILIMVNAERTYQQALWIDHMGKMNMLKYATGAYLDNYATRFGIMRSEGNRAKTTARITLSAVQESVVAIPKGTKISNGNGIYFETVDYAEVKSGALYTDVVCQCTENGSAANGLQEGKLNTLVDLIGYVDNVKNISVSQGGADKESDDELRMRIYGARAAWNSAGSEDSYRYMALSYNSNIEDVYVEKASPGTVRISVLLKDGEIPNDEFLNGLKEFLNHDAKKPLTDNLEVVAAKTAVFNIKLTYYVNYSEKGKAAAIQEQVKKAAEVYKKWQTEKIGRDIIPDYLVRLVMAAGAKRVVLESPQFSVVQNGTVPKAGNVSVIYGGIEDD